MLSTLLQSVLFFSPQFYCYPWKPLLNAVVGDSYEVAFEHFVSSHLSAPNIALHAICFVVQLVGNFCFLHVLDEMFFPGIPRPLSYLTAGLWVAYLVLRSSTAPVWGQVASTISIAGALWAAPFLVPHGAFVSQVLLGAFLVTKYLFLLTGFRAQMNVKAAFGTTAVLVAIHAGYFYLADATKASLEPHISDANNIFLAILLVFSMIKNPLLPTVAFGYLVGQTLAVASGQTWLFFFSFGFLGSTLQAVAHLVTREIPTLLALEKEKPDDKLRYEYAHVIFFPNLVFHGVEYYRQAVQKKAK
ncbi:hypothetical protein LEN26_001341 [Aphanomyces euteiches]|nr:hypothetical protein AeMF1_018568 [Aphanomyces euteiches]KAH9161647.1 hypothetical protein LEN26_001341 [Aphanomyces euteiches]KAH9190464.1 hypothetical protein AeNC1_007552 [Aphanomyces euteiches]